LLNSNHLFWGLLFIGTQCRPTECVLSATVKRQMLCISFESSAKY